MATCYYPNGDASPGDIPCSSGSGYSMCCPFNWSCEANGLCSLANQNFYGRYTCTDKTWQSSSCPKNICPHNPPASGDEAVLQCSAGSYCCDTNRPTVGCCDSLPTSDRFHLAQLPFIAGGSGAAASSSASASSSSTSSSFTSTSFAAATTSASSSTTSSSSISIPTPILKSITLDTSSSASSSISSTTSSSVSVLVITSVVTSDGSSSTLLSSSTSAVVAAASSSPSSSHSKNLALKIGLGVAVPIVVLALAALVFGLFLRRRRSRKAHPEPRSFQDPDNLQPMYGETKPTMPVTDDYKGKPELAGSPPLGGAAGYSPSTAPPSYRGVSGMSQTPNAMSYKQSPELDGSPAIGEPGNRGSRVSELAASPSTGSHPSPRESAIPENPQAEAEQGPRELPGDTFRPYRPPGLGVVNT